MKRVILLIMLLSLPLYGQISSHRGKTAAQLSAMEDYKTVANTSYWNSHAYDQIMDIVSRLDTVRYASDFSTIDLAVASVSNGFLVCPRDTYTVSGSSLTIGADVVLVMTKGALLHATSAKTVTIAGSVQAGPYKIFDDSLNVVFTKSATVIPQWWGAVDDSSTSSGNAAAINKALDASLYGESYSNMNRPTHTVHLPAGDYYIDGEIKMPSYTTLCGPARLFADSSFTMIESHNVDTTGSGNRIVIKDLTIDGGDSAFAIFIGDTSGSTHETQSDDPLPYSTTCPLLENLKIVNVAKGIELVRCEWAAIRDVYVYADLDYDPDSNYEYGIKVRIGNNVLLENCLVAGFLIDYHFRDCGGPTMFRCEAYSEAVHTHTTNLLRIEDCHALVVRDCFFEQLDTGDVDEVLVKANADGSRNWAFNVVDNKFINCIWEGVTDTKTGGSRLALGVAGDFGTVYGTLIEDCTFKAYTNFASESFYDIEFVNAKGTVIKNCKRQEGYTGIVADVPTTTGYFDGVVLPYGYYVDANSREQTANTVTAPYYYFDNVNDYIDIADDDNSDMGREDMTVTAMVRSGSIDDNNGMIITKNNHFTLNTKANYGTLQFTTYDGTTTSTCNSIQQISDNKWHYVAGVRDDRTSETGMLYTYVDGLPGDTTSDATKSLTDTDGLRFGGWSGDTFWGGQIARVRLFNLALTPNSIRELHTGSIPFKWQGAANTQLFDAAAAAFTSGTYAWTAYGTNTIANDANMLKVTYADNAGGAYNYLKDASDLNTDLTIGQQYRLTFAVKVNTGSVDVVVYGAGTSAVLIDTSVTSTTLDTMFVEFTATHATGDYIKFGGMGTGEIVWIDDLYLKRIGCVGEWDGAGADASTWHDKQNNMDGTVTGPVLYNQVEYLTSTDMEVDSVIHGGAPLRGTDTFTGSATADTIEITGVTTNSVFVVSINDVSVVANDLLGWTCTTDTLFVNRVAGTTANLKYSYIRID